MKSFIQTYWNYRACLTTSISCSYSLYATLEITIQQYIVLYQIHYMPSNVCQISLSCLAAQDFTIHNQACMVKGVEGMGPVNNHDQCNNFLLLISNIENENFKMRITK